jgi:hypothetical protein
MDMRDEKSRYEILLERVKKMGRMLKLENKVETEGYFG